MPPTFYRVMDWQDLVGQGVSQSRFINLNGIAKRANDSEPRIVANELVCAHLARAILLPVPPGFLVRGEDGEDPWFVSLDFNVSGERLPPANAAALADARPALAAGVVLFDIWVLNEDRHRGNLAFNRTTGDVGVFDHSRALAPRDVDVEEHLTARTSEHGIPRQCLAPHINSWPALQSWQERIAEVPAWFVKEAVAKGAELGYTDDEARLISEFLVDRRGRVLDLVRGHQGFFGSLEPELGLSVDEDRHSEASVPDAAAAAEDDLNGATGEEAAS